MPYVTLTPRTQIETQTKIRGAGQPVYTTVPAPYTPSQDDLAANDWGQAYPDAFQ